MSENKASESEKCPACGAKCNYSDTETRERTGYYNYACGSWRHTDEPLHQSDACKIAARDRTTAAQAERIAELEALAFAVGQCSPEDVPSAVYQAWSEPANYRESELVRLRDARDEAEDKVRKLERQLAEAREQRASLMGCCDCGGLFPIVELEPSSPDPECSPICRGCIERRTSSDSLSRIRASSGLPEGAGAEEVAERVEKLKASGDRQCESCGLWVQLNSPCGARGECCLKYTPASPVHAVSIGDDPTSIQTAFDFGCRAWIPRGRAAAEAARKGE